MQAEVFSQQLCEVERTTTWIGKARANPDDLLADRESTLPLVFQIPAMFTKESQPSRWLIATEPVAAVFDPESRKLTACH